MDYSHTIAIARGLVAEGRHRQASEVLGSIMGALDESRSGTDHVAMMRALSARVALLGHDDVRDALQHLESYRPLARRMQLCKRARAEVSTWLGWSLARAGDPRDVDLALTLFADAARLAETDPSSDSELWAMIGKTSSFVAHGSAELATFYAGLAETRLEETRDPAAAQLLRSLKNQIDDTTDLSSAGKLQSAGPPESVVRAAVEAGRPVLLVGERGTEHENVARSALGTMDMGACILRVIDCASLESPDALPVLAEKINDRANAVRGRAQPLLFRDIDQTPGGMQPAVEDFIRNQTRRGGIVFASCTRWLDEAVHDSGLNESLYIRLHAYSFELVPLRERAEEIASLCRSLAREISSAHDTAIVFTDEALEALVSYDWPGNMDELRTEIERLVRVAAVDPLRVIDVDDLQLRIHRHRASVTGGEVVSLINTEGELSAILDVVEREVITHALDTAEGQVAAAARSLGVSRQGLYKKMKRLSVRTANTHVSDR